MRSHNFCRSLPGYGNPVLPTGLLCDPEDTVQFLAQRRHIPADLVVSDARIDLSRGDPFMSQHLRYGFQRYALRERDRRGKCMPGHMDRRIERQPACLVTCRNDIFNVL